MLEETRELMDAEQPPVKEEKQQQPEATETREMHKEPMFASSLPLSEITAQPPISKVLHDVYDETRTTN
jgi:hypothetical protein